MPEPEPESTPGATPAPAPEPTPEPAPPAATGGRLRAGLRSRLPTALIAVLCLALGLAIATQVRRTNSGDTLADQRPQDLVVLLDGLQQREAALRKEIADAEAALNRLRASGDSSAAALAEAQRRADALAVLAGTAPAAGPGLEVEVTDPQHGIAPADLLDAVQELRAAGAEAIQVGTVRIGVDSAFTGSTGAVELDGVSLESPITVVAIGDPPTMAAALNIPGGAVDTVERAGGEMRISQLDRVEITALRTIRTPQYARPAG
jgi:uncharacterized protein YlxW (UPF0749 family)